MNEVLNEQWELIDAAKAIPNTGEQRLGQAVERIMSSRDGAGFLDLERVYQEEVVGELNQLKKRLGTIWLMVKGYRALPFVIALAIQLALPVSGTSIGVLSLFVSLSLYGMHENGTVGRIENSAKSVARQVDKALRFVSDQTITSKARTRN